MITRIRSLYNEGQNDGSITIKTIDKDLKVHRFVLELTSDFFNESMKKNDLAETPQIITLDFYSDLVNIVLNYMYSEKIIDKDLSGSDIINLFNLISQVRCKDFIMNLKNHYLKKFPKVLDNTNWCNLLRTVYGISKYYELEEALLYHFKNTILTELDGGNFNKLSDTFSLLEYNIKDQLFMISLDKIGKLNMDISRLMEETDEDSNHLNNFLKKPELSSDDENKDDIEEIEEVIKEPPIEIKNKKLSNKFRKK